MLQEFFQKAEIYSYIKWKNIKTKFEKDKRYYLIDTEHEKEYIYENLLKDYLLNKKDLQKSKPIKAENKTSQEDMPGQIQKTPVNINKNQQKDILDPKPERKESIRSKKHKSSSSSYSRSSSSSRSSHSKSSKSRSSSRSHSKKKHKKKHTRSRSRSRSSSRNRSKDKKRKNKYTENKDKKIAPERMDAEKPLEERKPRQNIKPKKPIKFSAEHGFQQMKLKEAEEGFNVMLAERIKSLNQPFREIEKILGNDPRFNSEYLTQELKEDLYDDFIREKKKIFYAQSKWSQEAGIKFKQALKEKVDLLNIYASFDDSIKIFADDKRFQALPKKDAEDLFRDFLRELRNSYLTDFERFLNETHYLTKDSPLEGEGYEELKNKLANFYTPLRGKTIKNTNFLLQEDIRYKRLDDFAEMRDRMIKKRIESIRQTYLQRGSKIDEIYKELLAERDDDDKEENQGEEKNEQILMRTEN